MNIQNLHVFLWNAIYLSLVPEIFTVPSLRTTHAPKKDYNYFMQVLRTSMEQVHAQTENLPNKIAFNATRKMRTGTKRETTTSMKTMGKFLKITTGNPSIWGRSVNKSTPTVATLKMAKLSKDQHGKWVYNPWVVTHGNQLKEDVVTKSSLKQQRVTVADNPNKIYNPEANLASVCTGTTIPYGEHKIMAWIDRHIYKRKHKNRVFYMDLRRDMYTKSNSDVCHNKTMTNWMEYQECSIRRNQRLESFVPKYPLHQRVREIAANKN